LGTGAGHTNDHHHVATINGRGEFHNSVFGDILGKTLQKSNTLFWS
jgi:hypothetical protein